MKRFLSAALYVLGLLALGFFGGGLIGGRVVGAGQVGFDGLADALGGVMVGILLAVVVAVATVPRLTVQGLVRGGIVTLVLAVAALVVLRALAGQ